MKKLLILSSLVLVNIFGCGPLNEGAQERPFAAHEITPADLPTTDKIDTTSGLVTKIGSVQVTNAAELALIFGQDVVPQSVVFQLSYKLSGNQVSSNTGELKLYAKKKNGKIYVYTFQNPKGSVTNNNIELTYHDRIADNQEGTIDVVGKTDSSGTINASLYLDCGVVSSCLKLGQAHSRDLT